jgi:hypothetical protein
MKTPYPARRTKDGLAIIGPTWADVTGTRFFNDDQGAPGGTGTPPAQEQNPTGTPGGADDPGFPANTPVAQMTAEQQAAYWRDQSKKQQSLAEKFAKLGDFDTVKKALDDAEASRQSALTEQQKAVEAAEAAAKTAGYEEARDKFARPAVAAILLARTKRADEKDEDATARVKGVVDALNVAAFLDEHGVLDAAKVETFAQSLAPTDSNGGSGQHGDPLADVLRRQSPTPVGSGGSVKAIEDEVYARLSTKK